MRPVTEQNKPNRRRCETCSQWVTSCDVCGEEPAGNIYERDDDQIRIRLYLCSDCFTRMVSGYDV